MMRPVLSSSVSLRNVFPAANKSVRRQMRWRTRPSNVSQAGPSGPVLLSGALCSAGENRGAAPGGTTVSRSDREATRPPVKTGRKRSCRGPVRGDGEV
eukprot:scaffold33294_cov62-Isochrysis_galbana.AAC.1